MPFRDGSLYKLHDDTKDKPFEVEITVLSEATKWMHKPVPRETMYVRLSHSCLCSMCVHPFQPFLCLPIIL